MLRVQAHCDDGVTLTVGVSTTTTIAQLCADIVATRNLENANTREALNLTIPQRFVIQVNQITMNGSIIVASLFGSQSEMSVEVRGFNVQLESAIIRSDVSDLLEQSLQLAQTSISLIEHYQSVTNTLHQVHEHFSTLARQLSSCINQTQIARINRERSVISLRESNMAESLRLPSSSSSSYLRHGLSLPSSPLQTPFHSSTNRNAHFSASNTIQSNSQSLPPFRPFQPSLFQHPLNPSYTTQRVNPTNSSFSENVNSTGINTNNNPVDDAFIRLPTKSTTRHAGLLEQTLLQMIRRSQLHNIDQNSDSEQDFVEYARHPNPTNTSISDDLPFRVGNPRNRLPDFTPANSSLAQQILVESNSSTSVPFAGLAASRTETLPLALRTNSDSQAPSVPAKGGETNASKKESNFSDDSNKDGDDERKEGEKRVPDAEEVTKGKKARNRRTQKENETYSKKEAYDGETDVIVTSNGSRGGVNERNTSRIKCPVSISADSAVQINTTVNGQTETVDVEQKLQMMLEPSNSRQSEDESYSENASDEESDEKLTHGVDEDQNKSARAIGVKHKADVSKPKAANRLGTDSGDDDNDYDEDHSLGTDTDDDDSDYDEDHSIELQPRHMVTSSNCSNAASSSTTQVANESSNTSSLVVGTIGEISDVEMVGVQPKYLQTILKLPQQTEFTSNNRLHQTEPSLASFDSKNKVDSCDDEEDDCEDSNSESDSDSESENENENESASESRIDCEVDNKRKFANPIDPEVPTLPKPVPKALAGLIIKRPGSDVRRKSPSHYMPTSLSSSAVRPSENSKTIPAVSTIRAPQITKTEIRERSIITSPTHVHPETIRRKEQSNRNNSDDSDGGNDDDDDDMPISTTLNSTAEKPVSGILQANITPQQISNERLRPITNTASNPALRPVQSASMQANSRVTKLDDLQSQTQCIATFKRRSSTSSSNSTSSSKSTSSPSSTSISNSNSSNGALNTASRDQNVNMEKRQLSISIVGKGGNMRENRSTCNQGKTEEARQETTSNSTPKVGNKVSLKNKRLIQNNLSIDEMHVQDKIQVDCENQTNSKLLQNGELPETATGTTSMAPESKRRRLPKQPKAQVNVEQDVTVHKFERSLELIYQEPPIQSSAPKNGLNATVSMGMASTTADSAPLTTVSRSTKPRIIGNAVGTVGAGKEVRFEATRIKSSKFKTNEKEMSISSNIQQTENTQKKLKSSAKAT